MAHKHKLAIIGSGPAGLTAAIYAGRGNLTPIVFAGDKPGGPLTYAWIVENFPGFPEGVDGADLINKMRQQAENFGVKFIEGDATKIDFQKRPFEVYAGEEKHEAEAVIIATGTEPVKLGLESEKRLTGKGVSYCATCDGPLFKNKKVIVLGGGETALKEAWFLSDIAKEVSIVQIFPYFTAPLIMQERVKAKENIKIFLSTEIKEFIGEKKLEKTRLFNNEEKKEWEMEADGVFIAIGRKPNTKIFENQVEMQNGFIVTKADSTETSVSGIFAAGDAVDRRFRQVIVAAGRGAMAAMEAEDYLRGAE